jgi:hypothetical protein
MEYYTALIFILNQSFVPYRKWRLKELQKLACRPEDFEAKLQRILTNVKWIKEEFEAKQSIVNELVAYLEEKLLKAGVPEEKLKNPWKFKVTCVPRI